MGYADTRHRLERLMKGWEDHSDPRFKKLKEEYEENEKAYAKRVAYRRALERRLLALIEPVKRLSVSSFTGVSNPTLIEVGKAAKVLYEAMKKAGLLH